MSGQEGRTKGTEGMEVLKQGSNNYLYNPTAHRMFATTPGMQPHPILQKKEQELGKQQAGPMHAGWSGCRVNAQRHHTEIIAGALRSW